MPKRKLSDLDTTTTTSVATDPSTTRTAQRLSVKFNHEVNVLSRALKVARGFEKQKMGRRGKKARSEEDSKPGTVGRLEEENKILKGLEMNTVAGKYLLKQLVRTKRIAEAPAFIHFRSTMMKDVTIEGPQSPAEGNVLARLYKSNPVKDVLPGIMEGFRRILGLDAQTGKKNDSTEARGKSEGGNGGKQAKAKDAAVNREGDRDVDVDMNMDEEASGSDEDGDDDFAQFDSRLAGSDSESDDDNDNDNDPMAISPSPSASRSQSPTSEPSREFSPQPKKPKTTISKEPPTSTTFLPSLSMGGYVSGSESEPSDDEGAQPRRKNRMGQQARRALWEKKYGLRANHVRKEAEKEKRSRDSGWDVRRGATGGSGRERKRGGQGQRRDNNRPQRGGDQKRKDIKDDKPLHPSWEAARKAKEQQKMNTAAFQGKKVTFD